MSEREHIGFYYGVTPHFGTAVRHARRRWPDARITIIAPPGYTPEDGWRDVVDDLMTTECARYSPLHPVACWRLAKALRARRFTHFVTLFKTLQQRILAVISGAERAETWCVDFRIRPMESTWPGLLWGTIRREAGGRLRYYLLWCYACVVWVRPAR